MNQTIKRIALIAAVLALPASGAMATPMAWFAFNGGPHHFINNWIQDQEGDWSGNFFLSTPLYHVVGNVHVQADPQIVYGVSVANSSPGMGTFTFDFTDTWATPIVGQTETYGAVGGHVTDATGNGISLNRVNPYLQMTDLNGLDSNTDAYNHDFARGPGFPGVVYDIGTDTQGPRPGPAGSFTVLHTRTEFDLSGSNDIAVLTGSSILFQNPIPEASTALLLVSGLAGLLVWKRKSLF